MKAMLGKVGMIAMVALVVVIAAGGATYFAVRTAMDKPAEATPAKTTKTAFKPVEAGEFLTNLADPGGRRVIHVKIELMVSDDKAVTKLKAEASAIRDQILRVLRNKTVVDLAGEDGMDNLAREIVNRLNVTVADGQVRELYFTDIAIQ